MMALVAASFSLSFAALGASIVVADFQRRRDWRFIALTAIVFGLLTGFTAVLAIELSPN